MDVIMDFTTYMICFICAGMAIILGIILFIFNRVRKKSTGKSSLPPIIVGWVLLALAIVGLAIATIVYTFSSSGTFGVFLLLMIAALFIIGGIAFFLGIGISSLAESLRKDKDGKRNKEGIVRGAALLFLAIAVLVTVIVTIAIMMHIESNKEKPVRMMISLLWMIKSLSVF